jgi:hypothetical protein
MNTARIAELLRQLADELDGDTDVEPRPPAKARPRPRAFPAPLNPVSETDRMAAQRMLRRRGIV